MQTPIMQTTGLHIGYRNPRQPPVVVATDISETLYAGEMVCLIGPNGAGKSTLLRTLAGLQPPLDGNVTLLGDDVFSLDEKTLARHLSVVLTGPHNLGLMTGYALVALGRHPYTDWLGRLSPHDEAVIRWAVAAVGAEDIADRFVNEMSDGERQKIMIARALAQEPSLMILDEPTAFLDLPRRVEIIYLLRRLARETNRTILLSTHDLDLALRSADRVWLMPSGEPLQAGTPEDLVLSGAFGAAFASEGVQFDIQTGSFHIDAPVQGAVRLRNEGLPPDDPALYWTQRALERSGFALDGSDETVNIACVTVQRDARPRWTLYPPNGTAPRTYATLQDLLAALQRLI